MASKGTRPFRAGGAGSGMADFGRSVTPGGGQIMPTKLQQALPDFQTFLGPCFLFLNCPRLSTNPSNFGDPIGTCTFFQVKKMRERKALRK